MLNESLINRAAFDEATAFKAKGGFARIDKVFRGGLLNVIDELSDYLYDDGGGAENANEKKLEPVSTSRRAF